MEVALWDEAITAVILTARISLLLTLCPIIHSGITPVHALSLEPSIHEHAHTLPVLITLHGVEVATTIAGVARLLATRCQTQSLPVSTTDERVSGSLGVLYQLTCLDVNTETSMAGTVHGRVFPIFSAL